MRKSRSPDQERVVRNLPQGFQGLFKTACVLGYQALPQPHPVGQKGLDGHGEGLTDVGFGLGIIALPAFHGSPDQKPFGPSIPREYLRRGEQL